MRKLTRTLGFSAILALFAGLVIACGGNSYHACAATIDSTSVLELPAAPPAPKPPAPPVRSVPKPPAQNVPKSSNNSKANNRAVTGKNNGTGGASKRTVTNPKSVITPPSSQYKRTAPGEKAYTPPANVRQPQQDINLVKNSMPRQLSMSSHDHYTSPVTHHVYIYHSPGYFSALGWHDPYDPFDPFNWTNPFSPFYGAHFSMVAHC